MMQAMGRTYVQRLNTRYNRTGTLWEGRYKASLLQSDEYLLTCQRYIELNPVRALYTGLDPDPATRQKAYRTLFCDTLSDAQLTRLRDNTNACTIIGNDRFKDQIATMLGRAVPTGKRGRPKKST
jgi:putative transposase